jgi:hypothetical protein
MKPDHREPVVMNGQAERGAADEGHRPGRPAF